MVDLTHLASVVAAGRAVGEFVCFVHSATPSGAKCCAEVRAAVVAGGEWMVLATSLASGRTMQLGGDAASRAPDLIAALAAFFEDEGERDGAMRAE